MTLTTQLFCQGYNARKPPGSLTAFFMFYGFTSLSTKYQTRNSFKQTKAFTGCATSKAFLVSSCKLGSDKLNLFDIGKILKVKYFNYGTGHAAFFGSKAFFFWVEVEAVRNRLACFGFPDSSELKAVVFRHFFSLLFYFLQFCCVYFVVHCF